jgi:CheY-like chemotaxis protein
MGYIVMATIIAVDDSPSTRRIVVDTLKEAGHAVMEAENGIEALKVLSGKKVDLIIMDIIMPKMDGFVACEKIKEIDDNVPFIFLSALGEEYDRIHSSN